MSPRQSSQTIPYAGFKQCLRVGAFPLIVCLSVAIVGFSLYYAINPLLLMVLMLGGVPAVFVWLERRIPYHEEWNHAMDGDAKVDIEHYFVNLFISPLVEKSYIYAGLWLLLALSLPTDGGGIFSGWPFPLKVLAGMLCGDFILYWFHRVQHAGGGFFWRMHSVHHAVRRVYWLNGSRINPVDLFFNIFIPMFLLNLAFQDKTVIVFYGYMKLVFATMAHANTDLHCGFWNLLFITPESHRWHHARDVGGRHVNFGSIFSFWDRLFGTFHLSHRCLGLEEVGSKDLDNPAYPKDYLKLCGLPFMKN